jgi:PAS domain S-box-containing protein
MLTVIYHIGISEAVPRKNNDLEINLKRLWSHVNNSPLAVIEFDPEYRIIQWSKKAESVFGWTAPEVLGKRISEIRWVHENDVAKITALSADMFEGRQAADINVNRNYRKDGSVIICEWHNSALFDTQGKLVSILSLVLDVTERKRVEEALDRTKSQLEFILNNSIDAAYQRNLQTDKYDYVSPVIESLTGFSAAAFSRLSFAEVLGRIHPDDMAALEKEVELTTLGARESGSVEYRFRVKTG